MLTSTSLLVTVGALVVEAAFGYPAWLLRRIGHPVIWAGAAIAWLDRTLNRETFPLRRFFSLSLWKRGGVRVAPHRVEEIGADCAAPSPCPFPEGEDLMRRLLGVVTVLGLVLGAGLPAWALQTVLLAGLPWPIAIALLAVAASTLLAQRSLWQHVAAVATGLDQGLPQGRSAVSHIVGRDPDSLDFAAVARAAIESLAENFSDGVVAPALWCALLGLPGIAIYKAINTADSMIGHRTPRYRAFGWAAARLDDLVNLPASRLAALLLASASRNGGLAARVVWRDAGRHRSPNAGWPEAAMAGALGLRLAGPRVYGAIPVEDGWMGDGRAEATGEDIRQALRLYRRACALMTVLAVAVFAMVVA